MSWSLHQPIAVIAPNLGHPARNGGAILIERTSRYLSRHCEHVDLLAMNSVRRYSSCEVETDQPIANRLRSKLIAGVRTLVNRSHYLHERFNTDSFKRAMQQQLRSPNYGTVVASYLTTLALLPPTGSGQRLFVWTQNDEFKWYRDLERTSRNPLGKAACRVSLRWLAREVPWLAKQAVFIHVSEADRLGFEEVVPGHRNIVASVGTDLDSELSPAPANEDDRIVLSFIGALGVQMALDALRHFRERFEPELRRAFGSRLLVQAAGSEPSRAVKDLCRDAGWGLHQDLSDEEFSRILAQTTFTILPFPYSTGAKLKLVRSLGSGIPFLCTSPSRPADWEPPPGCCFSDEPSQWRLAVEKWMSQSDRLSIRRKLLTLAQQHSWDTVTTKLARAMENSPA